MPGRSYSSTNKYRYGFNGKENDDEVKGEGNQQDYGMRIYDPRVGRFLSVDPLIAQYPELTPYQFASNRPLDGIDQDGLEWASQTELIINWGTGNAQLITTNYVKLKVINKSSFVKISPDIIKAKAEIVAREMEKKLTNIQIPLRLPDEIIQTKVILDFTPKNDETVPTIGRLNFDDRTSTSDVLTVTKNGMITTTTNTSSTPGETKGVIQNFDINIGITMDGQIVQDDELANTATHEGAHSAGANHPWSLSPIEKQISPNVNQNDPIFRNKKQILDNGMNSSENPNPEYRRNSGTLYTPGQIKALTERIKKDSYYEAKDL